MGQSTDLGSYRHATINPQQGKKEIEKRQETLVGLDQNHQIHCELYPVFVCFVSSATYIRRNSTIYLLPQTPYLQTKADDVVTVVQRKMAATKVIHGTTPPLMSNLPSDRGFAYSSCLAMIHNAKSIPMTTVVSSDATTVSKSEQMETLRLSMSKQVKKASAVRTAAIGCRTRTTVRALTAIATSWGCPVVSKTSAVTS